MSKEPFRFLGKREVEERDRLGRPMKVTHCEYEASFWEGPSEPGQIGRYVRHRVSDTYFNAKGRFLNTAPSVSYYDQLRRAVA